jgi:hypothetical protein
MPEDHVPLLRAAGLLDVPEFPAVRTPPADMCGEHGRIWRAWWTYAKSYDPRNPKEFGGAHIADNRTSHAERRADWLRKGVEQLRLTEQICRSGRSPQCGPAGGPR